jgi:hypothetical protein
LAPNEDNPDLNAAQDFDYSDEVKQERCPYASHVRYHLLTRLHEIDTPHVDIYFFGSILEKPTHVMVLQLTGTLKETPCLTS